MFKRCGIFIIALIIGLSSTGCFGQMEIDRVSFPITLGIDYLAETNSIKVYAQILDTASGNSGGQQPAQKTFEVLSGEGNTLLDAMADVTSKGSQNISWKHTTVILFSRRMAEHGISKELDLLCRFQQIHMNSYIMATNEELQNVLDVKPKLESSLPAPLSAIRLVSNQSSHAKAVSIKEFIVDYLSEGMEPVIPMLEITKNVQDEVVFDYTGLGFFKSDKLIGDLDENETKGAILIYGRNNISRITIPDPADGTEEEFTIRSIHSIPTIVPHLYQNKPSISLHLDIQYVLAQSAILNKLDSLGDDRINHKVEQYVKENVKLAISKSKKFSADLFGFGVSIYRKYPQFWVKNKNQWDELYPDLPVTITVKATMKNTGELINSLDYLHQKD